MPKKENLQGYKQVGKRFIPPLKQLPGLREFSYVDDMLPELIWLGLVHDLKGYKFGTRVLEVVHEVMREQQESDEFRNFALQSSYASLSERYKQQMASAWGEYGMLDDIRYALAPLVLLYDGCALAFVGPPATALSEDILLSRLRETVSRHLDKYQTPGIALNAAMMLMRLMAGKIHIAEHIELPDLNAIFERPESDEARRAAAFVRASAGGEWGMNETGGEWARYFWNHGAELATCEYPSWALEDE